MDLKTLIKDSAKSEKNITTKATFNDVEFEIGFLTAPKYQKLKEACQTRRYDKKLRDTVVGIDSEKFSKKFSKLVVHGWKGMTIRKMITFVYIEFPENEVVDLNKEIPFDHEIVELMLQNSMEFNDFVSNTCMDVELFSLESVDDEPDEQDDETFDSSDTDAEKN